ncbi:MAG: HDIG domain-containing protein [Bacteroidaceae bacterium]|nr:HDIG domain-containing protein [Bacteroidaceae bacterium]
MRRPLISLCISVIGCIVLVVTMLPRETKFGYSYETGRPWHYAPLIAQYDFPIYKSEEQLKADRDSAMAGFQPFFLQTDSMAFRQGRHLLSDWQAGRFKGTTYNQVAHVGKLLEEVYARGIIANHDMASCLNRKPRGIRVLTGTKSQSRPMTDVLTPLAAYEYIMHADTLHYQRQDLARLQLNEYLQPNLHFDSIRTRRAVQDLLASVSGTLGMVQSGQKIIDRGEIVTEETRLILDSFKRESELRKDSSSNFRYLLAGQIGVVIAVVLLIVIYLSLFRKDVIQSPHHVSMIFTLLTVFPLLTSLMIHNHLPHVYLLPYAMAPIFIRVFIDSRTAVMELTAMVLLSSLALHQPYSFVLTELVAGLVAIYSLRELTARSQIFKSAITITLSTAVFRLFLDFMQGATFATLDPSVYYYMIVGGVLLLFAYPLMYLVERLFAFTSDVTLVELTNINHPLLRKMSKVAQGTFVHSMQVANLAAEVANKIGASSQLVRTAALYHDIGKIQAPAFFTENQAGHNPHDQLPEEQSAGIIISHVTEGLKLADKYNLPAEVREFILTHHGVGRVGYFYMQAVNRRGEERVNPADFTYPGRSPYTREQAILMMTDAVEAASRSLKEYTEESIQQLVDRIIDGQLKAGNFRECPISFRDIDQAKKVLCESLKTIYHTRIAYPSTGNDDTSDSALPDRPTPSPALHHPSFRTTTFGLHKGK